MAGREPTTEGFLQISERIRYPLCYPRPPCIFYPACSATTPGSATERDFLLLTEALLKNYNHQVRPIANQSASMNISLDFNLISINDVDDVRQLISVMATTVVYWHDKNLIWDPDEFGGLNSMYFGPDEIWTPRIYFLKSHDMINALFSYPTHHVVSSRGEVMFSSTAKLTCSCKLDLVLFPTDIQSCQFRFAVFDSSTKDVDLVVDVGTSNSTPIEFTENGEWEVLDTVAEPKEKSPLGYVTGSAIVRIKRRPHFYYLNIYTPVFSIAFLCLLTFFVPLDSGERLSYVLNMHLSLSVYISYVGDIMPIASKGMPNVFYILSALFFSSVLCVAMTALIMALRWSKVTKSNEGVKSVKILWFEIKIGEETPSFTDSNHSEAVATSQKQSNLVKYDVIRRVSNDSTEKEDKIFMIFPTGEVVKRLKTDEAEATNTNTTGQENPKQVSKKPISDASEFNSFNIIDSDLIRVCNKLDYWGFVVVSTFIISVTVFTSLNPRWY
ncbi:neuronal acetylcholine receptor subunit alpha-7 [Plakobranchus ocellatus]|uniref:Neuronal acetylcholine receptor subunit alpha-7 n=1 Tax=Plakobranchus ocellatus TaxID=259542 RepID=A0AAV3YFY6_9GAST|nr:neuronal acetylcholine receptor subunit alpha-7 [Plakobranchus ocellatus]